MTSRAPRGERTALLAIAFTISFILRPHACSMETLHGGKGETRLLSVAARSWRSVGLTTTGDSPRLGCARRP